MLLKTSSDIPGSEITDKRLYLGRRRFITMAAALPLAAKGVVTTDEKPTPQDAVTTYNNFYEFGTGKDDPARLAPKTFKPLKPWTIAVEGECAKPATVDYDDLIKTAKLEERIYRLRCVEGWSMVIPWVGVPLAGVLARFEPTSKARYVEFTTVADPVRMPNLKDRVLDWPYIEGLRLDEAMNPLTLLAVGLYGEELLPQNGAPIRLVVPWKYGFKSAKSIVRIRFVEQRPVNSWQRANPREYGFYSNVNPEVDHPRWSQAKERRIGEFLRRPTLMFNGYADQVGGMYAGMDLAKEF